MKGLLLASSVALAFVVGSAWAGDMPLKAPYAPPVATWTGCYVDGSGYTQARFDQIDLYTSSLA